MLEYPGIRCLFDQGGLILKQTANIPGYFLNRIFVMTHFL